MSEHTPETLRIGSSARVVMAGLARRVATIVECDESGANARRVVACWNAAHEAGLSTEALEAGVVKDALAACEAVDAHLKTAFPPYALGESPYDLIRAVLTKAKGLST